MEGLGREGRQKGRTNQERTADPGSFILSLPFFPLRRLLQVPLRELSSLRACLPALKSCSSLFLCHKRKAGAEKEGGRVAPTSDRYHQTTDKTMTTKVVLNRDCSRARPRARWREQQRDGRRVVRPTGMAWSVRSSKRRSLAGCDASKRLRGRADRQAEPLPQPFALVPCGEDPRPRMRLA